jgi:hypothetical protein
MWTDRHDSQVWGSSYISSSPVKPHVLAPTFNQKTCNLSNCIKMVSVVGHMDTTISQKEKLNQKKPRQMDPKETRNRWPAHDAVNRTTPPIYTPRSATTSTSSSVRRPPQLWCSSSPWHFHPRFRTSPRLPYKLPLLRPCQQMAIAGKLCVWQLLIMEFLMVATLHCRPAKKGPSPLRSSLALLSSCLPSRLSNPPPMVRWSARRIRFDPIPRSGPTPPSSTAWSPAAGCIESPSAAWRPAAGRPAPAQSTIRREVRGHASSEATTACEETAVYACGMWSGISAEVEQIEKEPCVTKCNVIEAATSVWSQTLDG